MRGQILIDLVVTDEGNRHANFLHIKTKIVEGWLNKETGVRGEPRIQYTNFKLLQDVVKTFAKKLSIQLKLDDIKNEKINSIKSLLSQHNGTNK